MKQTPSAIIQMIADGSTQWTSGLNLLIVGERSDLYLRASAGFMVCQLGLLVGLRGEGLATLLAAVASLQILWLFVWHALAHHLVGLTLKQTLLDVFPFAAAALVMVAAAWWCTWNTRYSFL